MDEADLPSTSRYPMINYLRGSSGIDMESKRSIIVVGLGYVGCVSAACFAEIGHDVLGVDRDLNKMESVRKAQSPFFEARPVTSPISLFSCTSESRNRATPRNSWMFFADSS